MKKTAVDIIRQISHEVEGRKLPMEIMVRDIQMMHFKLRSVLGDISSIDSMNYDFIESLWKIGRIDEIITDTLHELDEDNQEALLDYFKDVESDIQFTIRHSLNLHTKTDEEQMLKIEIFKEAPLDSTVH